jgi:outer membrane lipoprotein carrier protein
MMIAMWRIAIILIAAYAGSAGATGLEGLESFVKTAKSGHADFTQVVTSPSRDGQVARAKTSSGTFSFQRPNRFKFVYKKPFAQSIVADGQTLWLYDVDLNQVTARKQAQALSATPAALIASAADLKALQADFVLANDADRDGLEWAVATPKGKDSSVQQVRMGFKGNTLAVLEILDSFGQKSVMRYSAFDINGPVEPGAFQFKPPAGADVIAQ